MDNLIALCNDVVAELQQLINLGEVGAPEELLEKHRGSAKRCLRKLRTQTKAGDLHKGARTYLNLVGNRERVYSDSVEYFKHKVKEMITKKNPPTAVKLEDDAVIKTETTAISSSSGVPACVKSETLSQVHNLTEKDDDDDDNDSEKKRTLNDDTTSATAQMKQEAVEESTNMNRERKKHKKKKDAVEIARHDDTNTNGGMDEPLCGPCPFNESSVEETTIREKKTKQQKKKKDAVETARHDDATTKGGIDEPLCGPSTYTESSVLITPNKTRDDGNVPVGQQHRHGGIAGKTLATSSLKNSSKNHSNHAIISNGGNVPVDQHHRHGDIDILSLKPGDQVDIYWTPRMKKWYSATVLEISTTSDLPHKITYNDNTGGWCDLSEEITRSPLVNDLPSTKLSSKSGGGREVGETIGLQGHAPRSSSAKQEKKEFEKLLDKRLMVLDKMQYLIQYKGNHYLEARWECADDLDPDILDKVVRVPPNERRRTHTR